MYTTYRGRVGSILVQQLSALAEHTASREFCCSASSEVRLSAFSIACLPDQLGISSRCIWDPQFALGILVRFSAQRFSVSRFRQLAKHDFSCAPALSSTEQSTSFPTAAIPERPSTPVTLYTSRRLRDDRLATMADYDRRGGGSSYNPRKRRYRGRLVLAFEASRSALSVRFAIPLALRGADSSWIVH